MKLFFKINASLLKFSGEKSAQLLHGQLTNDIKRLDNLRGNYNLLLNQKGKIRADLFVLRKDVDFYLLTKPRFTNIILEHFSKLAPLSLVEMRDETSDYCVYHILSLIPPPIFSFRSDRLGIQGYDLIVTKDQEISLLTTLKDKGFTELGEKDQKIIRMEQGIPEVGVDVTEENFPQEGGLERAVSFTKGCYLGQEIVARLQYRGHVNKVLVRLTIEGKEIPRSGEKILDGEKEVGVITSAIFSDRLRFTLAFGYVPYKLNEEGREFEVGKGRVKARIVITSTAK